jgi:hypothetical protein
MKTNIEKMSVFRLSIMLMKTNKLNHSFHYVDENKGESSWTRDQQNVACSHSSLPAFMSATAIGHGQDPEGSGQAGHATRRGTGVCMKMAVPKTLWSAAAKLPLSAHGACGSFATALQSASRTHQGGSPAVLRVGRGYNWFRPSGDGFWDSSPDRREKQAQKKRITYAPIRSGAGPVHHEFAGHSVRPQGPNALNSGRAGPNKVNFSSGGQNVTSTH